MKRIRIYTVHIDPSTRPVDRIRMMAPSHRVADSDIEKFANEKFEVATFVLWDSTATVVAAYPKDMEYDEASNQLRKLLASPVIARDSVLVDYPFVVAASKVPMTMFFNALHGRVVDVQIGQEARYAIRVRQPAPAWRTGLGIVTAVEKDYVLLKVRKSGLVKTVLRENLLLVVNNEEKNESWAD